MDSLLCETPSLIPTLSLSLPQASEGPAPASPAPTAAPPATASTSTCSNQAKGVKVSRGRRPRAFDTSDTSRDLPRVRPQVKEESVLPQIKLEPHEVDQFLNLSPKGGFPL